jgi:hypothetical protein
MRSRPNFKPLSIMDRTRGLLFGEYGLLENAAPLTAVSLYFEKLTNEVKGLMINFS